MANDITITVVGRVVSEISQSTTRGGDCVANFRIAVTARRFDRASRQWADGETGFFSVACFGALGRNVAQSVHMRDAVVVTGRLEAKDVARQDDPTRTRTYLDIIAASVGHDLNRGTASFDPTRSAAVVATEERAVAEALSHREPAA